MNCGFNFELVLETIRQHSSTSSGGGTARVNGMNLPTTFDPVAYTRDIENAAYAAGWTVRHLSPMESGPRPWFQRIAPHGDSASPRLYLSAGIHGDEISGPLSLLEMIRQPGFFAAFDVTMFPILNPEGLARGLRMNRHGIDLNRDYRNSRSLEIKGHIETLLTLRPFRRVDDAARGLRGHWRLSLRAQRHSRSRARDQDHRGDGTPCADRSAPGDRGGAGARRRHLEARYYRQTRPD